MMKLSPMEQRIYDVLSKKPNVDVPIYKIYEHVYETNVHVMQSGTLILGMENREMQQRLGPRIRRLNEKLAERKMEVQPGHVKRTYALRPINR